MDNTADREPEWLSEQNRRGARGTAGEGLRAAAPGPARAGEKCAARCATESGTSAEAETRLVKRLNIAPATSTCKHARVRILNLHHVGNTSQ